MVDVQGFSTQFLTETAALDASPFIVFDEEGSEKHYQVQRVKNQYKFTRFLSSGSNSQPLMKPDEVVCVRYSKNKGPQYEEGVSISKPPLDAGSDISDIGVLSEKITVNDIPTIESALNIINKELYEAIFDECQTGGAGIQHLLEKGLNLYQTNRNGLVALHIAAINGHVEIIKELLKQGVAVDVKSKGGGTALQFATLSNRPECVNFLMQHGASEIVVNKKGATPLIVAAKYGYSACLDLLNTERCRNIQSKFGNAAILVALSYGQTECAQKLLDSGANASIRNNYSSNVFHAAVLGNQVELVDVLKTKTLGNELNRRDRQGSTPLHLAFYCNKLDCIIKLKEIGAKQQCSLLSLGFYSVVRGKTFSNLKHVYRTP
ncbi:ankyrin repeat domain-containing protein [Parashewanella spongiae]|nr:ankyrin repeat domain-containing protein [Parashewanella spongiae]